MKNETIKLSIEEQNDFSISAFQLAISENINYAEESGEGIAEYFVRDFEASPEGWNCVFDYSYDEISSKAKEQRKIVLIRLLAQEGYVIQS